MAGVYEGGLVKGEHTPPHILPHTHMHSQLEMTQTSCVHEGDMWKDKCAFPHILPHAHMHGQLEMTQTVCVCEGGHVERQAYPSTHSPPHTHAWPQ